ncbi:hypothetical protein BBP40_006390 [Aspergillus hancockii]|nr:hypothetical protein BBP40_006390 [Aspergillus hancockii]
MGTHIYTKPLPVYQATIATISVPATSLEDLVRPHAPQRCLMTYSVKATADSIGIDIRGSLASFPNTQLRLPYAQAIINLSIADAEPLLDAPKSFVNSIENHIIISV